MSRSQIVAIVFAVVCVAGLTAGPGALDSASAAPRGPAFGGPVGADDFAEDIAAPEPESANTYRLRKGWVRGQRVHYYDLGEWNGKLDPVYQFYWRNGMPVQNQPPVYRRAPSGVEGAPGSERYSHVKRLYKVFVPDFYTVNSLRSVAQIKSADRLNIKIEKTDTLLLHAIVPSGSELEDDPINRQPQPGWIGGQKVHFFDFSRWAGVSKLSENGEVPTQRCFSAPLYPETQHTVFEGMPGKVLRWKAWRNRVDTNEQSYSPVCGETEFYPVTPWNWYRPNRVRSARWLLDHSSALDRVRHPRQILGGYDNTGTPLDALIVTRETGEHYIRPIVGAAPPPAGGDPSG